jgi:hypothetical protein
MPHLVMLDFQPTTVAFFTRSTFGAQANKAQEVGEEMEINSPKIATEIGIGTQEELSS